jgi:hypothetical protein
MKLLAHRRTKKKRARASAFLLCRLSSRGVIPSNSDDTVGSREVRPTPRRISRASAKFFLDWVRERENRIKINDARQQAEVLAYHREAERFWDERAIHANAD